MMPYLPALKIWLLILSFGVVDLEPAQSQSAQPVELELVLAIDTSTSVNTAEFDLQRQGLANAFRDPNVIAAIQAVGGNGIAVSVIQWSGPFKHQTSVDWWQIKSEAEAYQFATMIDKAPRLLRGLTDIGGAIRFSRQRIDQNAFEGTRKVIDISGDGISGGRSLMAERDAAIASGITINGLVILEPDPELWEFGLLDHYENEVIGGDGAFVMIAQSFEDFADVIRRKLIREIVGFNLALAEPEIKNKN